MGESGSKQEKSVLVSQFEAFVGDNEVCNFKDFCSSQDGGVGFVVACCLDVVEGVDMWFPEDPVQVGPRLVCFGVLVFAF